MHNLEYNTEQKNFSFISSENNSWHGLGKVADGTMTARECIEGANMDYGVIQSRLMYESAAGEMVAYPNRYANIRDDNGAALGLVSDRYEIIQNIDCFSFFDAIVGEGEAIYHTAGVLGKGERIFVSAKLPEDMRVGGEMIEKYIVLTNSHDGSSGIVAGFTTVRVVCQNTLHAALRSMTNSVSISHTSGAKEKWETAYKLMGITSAYMEEVNVIFERMAETKMAEDQLKDYVLNVMKPMTTKRFISYDDDVVREKNENLWLKTDEIVNFAMTHPTQTTETTKGSLFGAYNSISGYYAHLKKYKSSRGKSAGEKKTKEELFGLGASRIKRAFADANKRLF